MPINLRTLTRAALPIATGYLQGRGLRQEEDERREREKREIERQNRIDQQNAAMQEINRQLAEERLTDMRAPAEPETPFAVTAGALRGAFATEPEARGFYDRNRDTIPEPAGARLTPGQAYTQRRDSERQSRTDAEAYARARVRQGVPIPLTDRGSVTWLADQIRQNFPDIPMQAAIGIAGDALVARRSPIGEPRPRDPFEEEDEDVSASAFSTAFGGSPSPAANRAAAEPAGAGPPPVDELDEARAMVRGMSPDRARALLTQAGFSPEEIAQIVGG